LAKLELPSWRFRETGDGGRATCDVKWVEAISLKADGGWHEIQQRLDELNAKYQEWNKAASPGASHFFPPISAKEA
jgi:hypothetical protein